MRLLIDEEITKAWDNAFNKPVYLDHKPTAEELFAIRMRAVAQAQLEKTKEDIKVCLKSCQHSTDSEGNIIVHIPLSLWNDLTA